jgi:hypothetical protein
MSKSSVQGVLPTVLIKKLSKISPMLRNGSSLPRVGTTRKEKKCEGGEGGWGRFFLFCFSGGRRRWVGSNNKTISFINVRQVREF